MAASSCACDIDRPFQLNKIQPHYKKSTRKYRLDIKRENLPFVAPYLWVKHKDKEKKTCGIITPDILFKECYQFISGLIHIHSLLNDTADVMKVFTKSNGVIIYLVDSITNQIYVCPQFDDTDEMSRVSWNIRTGSTIPAYVALTKQIVLVNNMKIGEKFQTYDWKDMTVTGVLCVPVVLSDGSCYGVIELYRRNGMKYEQRDMKKIISISRLIATAIDHHLYLLNLQTKRMLINYLLTLTQFYFTNTDQLHHMIHDIVHLAKKTMNSERGSYFMYDYKILALYEDTCCNPNANNAIHRQKIKIQKMKERGIAGLALKTCKLINIKDAYNDPRFDRESDVKSGQITRSILCMPVMGHHHHTLGVLQLLNKREGFYTSLDEQLFFLFVHFCTIAIEYKNLHEKYVISQKRNEVYNDYYFSQIMNIKTKPQYDIDVDAIALPSDFFQYSFYPTKEDDIIKYACFILKSLRIPGENCTNFIFSVHRGYRNNHYHNFEHAFNVLHMVACLVNCEPSKFDYLERVGLLLAAICHDIDHRGVTSYFLEVIKSPFVMLYDESPLENHHFFVTMLILEQSSIKTKFSSAEYKILIEYIREMILATDLTRHLQERTNIRVLCDNIKNVGEKVWTDNLDNRRRVRNLIMTAADLSGNAKPFRITKENVRHIMEEFYEESEHIKHLGHTPLAAMDIKYIDKIPEYQLQFLDIVCIPCFELLQLILPQSNELLRMSQSLRTTWIELIKVRDSRK